MNINFETELSNAIIYGNSSQITNAIINVVKNGIEASDENSNIDIKLEEEYLDIVPRNSITGINPDGVYYKLSITDYGSGISGENLDKIFNPFFSTKGENEGTGLGLSAVLSTILASKGIISVETTEGEGSTFTLYFPKNN